jgi:hypothetical protein
VIGLQAVDPDTARDDVRQILDDRRYRSDPAPRPFRGPLRWLGDRLETIGRWIGDLAALLPWFLWLTLGIGIVALAVVWIVRRTNVTRRVKSSSPVTAHDAVREDPAALEREADEAERGGELERAVRLRFRAGLLRLGDRGVIEYRPSLTTSEVRALLGSETFEQLARTFEHVAYGGRAAAAPDVADARAKWPQVVKEGRRR